MSDGRRARVRLTGLALGLVLAVVGAGCQSVPGSRDPTAPPPMATAAPTGPSPVDSAALARGATAFRAWCNSCHPGGQAGNGPALWGDGRQHTAERIRQQIRHSDPREQRRFLTLTDAQLDEIILYIHAQQRLAGGAGR